MAGLLKDRVAVVTGAAMGNGQGIARAMAREGARVALLDASDQVEETAESIRRGGPEAIAFQLDVVHSGQVKEAVKKTLELFGKVDILANNADIFPVVPFVEMTDEIRDRVFEVNIKGYWNCIQAIVSTMIKQNYGKIINVSSVTGPFTSDPGLAAYSASKGAVSGLTRALALELAPYGINVNAICPGFIDTPGMRRAEEEAWGQEAAGYIEKVAQTVPLGRLGAIEDVGNLAVFLASEMSSYITGTEIVIDGGNIIQEMKGAGLG